MHPDVLFATPALRERSRTLVSQLVASPPALEPRHQVRLAAHMLALGAGSSALDCLNEATDVDGDDAVTARYLRHRLAVSMGGDVPSSLLGPLGPPRMAILRALAATLAADVPSASAAWHQAATADAPDGLARDELRAAAWEAHGRLTLCLDPVQAIEALRVAAQLMQAMGCERDEASVLVPLVEAYQRTGDRTGLLAVAGRLQQLPTSVIGGLPASLHCRLQAARLASEGRTIDAAREVERGLAQARAEKNGAGFASLAISKADLAGILDRPEVAWRTLTTSAAVLRNWGHPAYAAAVSQHLHTVEHTQADALPQWRARLTAELSR